MKTLYIDAFSGISGDKMVAALLSLDADKEKYLKEINTLSMRDEFEIEITRKMVSGIDCYKFNVLLHTENHQHGNEDPCHHEDHQHHDHHHHSHKLQKTEEKQHDHHHRRSFSDIKKIIAASKISNRAKEIAVGIFTILGEAEAKVHQKNIEEIHFHEVGAVDSIVDIVSVGILIDLLAIDEIYSSSIPLGKGFVKCMHGVIPIPAPATSEILKNIPVYQGDIDFELTTPTGAAIVKYLVKEYQNMPSFTYSQIGYGAGSKDLVIPNFLRLFLGEPLKKKVENV